MTPGMIVEDLRVKVEDRRRRDFSVIDNAVIDDFAPYLKAEGVALYLVLVRIADRRESPSIRHLAAHLQMGVATVHRRLLIMEQLGLLVVERRKRSDGGNAVNLYRLLTPPALSDALRGLHPDGDPPAPPRGNSSPTWCCESAQEPSPRGGRPRTRPVVAERRPRGRPRKNHGNPVPLEKQGFVGLLPGPETHRKNRGNPVPAEHTSTLGVPLEHPRTHQENHGNPVPLDAHSPFNPFNERIERSGNSAENAADFLPPSGTAGLAAGTRDLLSRERKNELLPLVEAAEDVLDDHHSRGQLLLLADRCHPHALDVWHGALRAACEEPAIRTSRGALFTHLLKRAATTRQEFPCVSETHVAPTSGAEVAHAAPGLAVDRILAAWEDISDAERSALEERVADEYGYAATNRDGIMWKALVVRAWLSEAAPTFAQAEPSEPPGDEEETG